MTDDKTASTNDRGFEDSPGSMFQFLIISDNDDFSRILQHDIADKLKLKFKLTTAVTPAKAISRLEKSPVDIIFLDLNNIAGDRLDTYLALAESKERLAPVIILNANRDEKLTRAVIQHGSRDFIVNNPLDATEVSTTIKKALSRNVHNFGSNVADMQLDERESYIRAVFELTSDAFLIIDNKGIIRFLNPAAERMFWRESGIMINKEFGFPLTTNGKVLVDIVHRNGESGTAEMTISTISWGGQPAYLAVLKDITFKIRAENKFHRLNKVYNILSGINALILKADTQETLFNEAARIAVDEGGLPVVWILTVNQADREIDLATWYGIKPNFDFLEAIKRRCAETMDNNPESSFIPSVIHSKKAAVANDVFKDSRIALKKNALELGIRSIAVIPVLVKNEVTALIGLHASEAGFFDNEKMKLLNDLADNIGFALENIEKNERLEYLANFDVTTGLINRNFMKQRMCNSIEFAKRCNTNTAILFIDLDRFKIINDTLGHSYGDEVLKHVSERITACVRKMDSVSRQGGDEFLILLASSPRQITAINGVAQRVLDAFRSPILLSSGEEIFLTCSIGIATYPSDGDNHEELIKNADIAMYMAKSAGGNCYKFYETEPDNRLPSRLQLETAIRHAMDNDEFRLHYQPKVDAQTGEVKGSEALIRWHSPVHGTIPPDVFIPIAEESGLILSIGEWVLTQACQQGALWKDVQISVNLSARQMQQKNLPQTIKQILQTTGLNPALLDLEITESTVIHNMHTAIDIMASLKKLGVSLSMDDFGTGYSSLNYLNKLPFDTVKIDRSFISEITTNPDSEALVKAIILMAHSLNLKVVAEGVETTEQYQKLLSQHCELIQGFFFSKPLPPEEFIKLLEVNFELPESGNKASNDEAENIPAMQNDAPAPEAPQS